MGEQVFPEPTRPHGPRDPDFSDSSDFAVDKAITDQSILENAIPAGLGGISRQGMLQWPLPHTGPTKRVAVAAVVGLAMAIITLIIVAALVGNSLQAALSRPSGTSSRVVPASPSPHGQQAAVAALPTATGIPTTSTLSPPTTIPLAPTGWLVVAPTQVALDCHSAQSVMLQLTNRGPEAVSWAAETPSSHQSGVGVQPASGSLAAGATQAITLSVSSGNSSGSQGTIQFAVVSGQPTTNPAQVSYTTTGCGGD